MTESIHTGKQVDERVKTLSDFEDGIYPEQVFGIDRQSECAKLCGWLNGIRPTHGERMEAALGFGSPKRIAAYDNGRKWVKGAYYDYAKAYLLEDADEVSVT